MAPVCEVDSNQVCNTFASRLPLNPSPEIVLVESSAENERALLRSCAIRVGDLYYLDQSDFYERGIGLCPRPPGLCRSGAPESRREARNQEPSGISPRGRNILNIFLRRSAIKTLLLQAGEEETEHHLAAEIRSAVSKLETSGLHNEMIGLIPEVPVKRDSRIPFHKTQEFGDALMTVHELERTGSLWVRGTMPGQEGRSISCRAKW